VCSSLSIINCLSRQSCLPMSLAVPKSCWVSALYSRSLMWPMPAFNGASLFKVMIFCDLRTCCVIDLAFCLSSLVKWSFFPYIDWCIMFAFALNPACSVLVFLTLITIFWSSSSSSSSDFEGSVYLAVVYLDLDSLFLKLMPVSMPWLKKELELYFIFCW